MPKILQLPKPSSCGSEATLVEDTAAEPLAQAEFLKEPAKHGAVGVRVTPADKIEDLAPHLKQVAWVAIEFPGPGEGRGYTYARLLRQRYGYQGEIRAVGPAVKQDLLFFMVRCGFSAFALVPTENVDEARKSLNRFTLAYQPAVPRPDVREARYTAARH